MAEGRQTGKADGSIWPKRGEIYLTALDPTIGHEIRKTRPALVIQNDASGRYGAVTMVAPITSTVRPAAVAASRPPAKAVPRLGTAPPSTVTSSRYHIGIIELRQLLPALTTSGGLLY
jgi:mRNA-degrading endonuclease toxin of MazEF toxin-antitoxin module